MKEENLIFIISQPRSGSTYLQNLLSNNDEVNTSSESWILLNYVNQIKPKLMEGAYDNKLAVGAFYNYKESFPELDVRSNLKEHLLNIYKPLLGTHRFAIDKTPRYWEIVDEIAMLFPKSRIIILKRNPLEVVRSLVKTYGMATLQELNQFRRDILYAPKRLHKFCQTHANNPNVFILRYEDLKSDTEAQVMSLYKWIGADYQPAMLDVSGNTKYRGHFGDPFQNMPEDYTTSRKKAQEHIVNKTLRQFIAGYSTYLGDGFLNDYGDYSSENKDNKRTTAFKYFEFMGSYPADAIRKRGIKGYFKKLFFKLRFG